MRKRLQISYNPYFLVPFLLWVIGGGILCASYTKKEIFVAINSHYSNVADTVMYHLTMIGQAEVIVPVLALVMLIPAYRNSWYFITALLSNTIPLLIEQGLKTFFNSPRPLKYFHNPGWVHIVPTWPYLYDRSFPSGHTEGAFCFLCFLSLLLPKGYRAWGALFFVIALSVGYSRIYLTAHFFADVYAGSIIGVVMCTIIFSILKKNKGFFFGKKKPANYA